MADLSDPVDRMIYQRATRSLLLNGLAPVVTAIFSLFCNPCGVFTILTIIAAVSTFAVPVAMRRRLEEEHLFPAWAANVGRAMGVLACLLSALSWGVWTFVVS